MSLKPLNILPAEATIKVVTLSAISLRVVARSNSYSAKKSFKPKRLVILAMLSPIQGKSANLEIPLKFMVLISPSKITKLSIAS